MMSQHIFRDPPTRKRPPLIVVLAFDLDAEGDLRPAIEPIEKQSEMAARVTAALLANKHAGVIAWKRSAQPDQGEFGQPEILFQRGAVPEME